MHFKGRKIVFDVYGKNTTFTGNYFTLRNKNKNAENENTVINAEDKKVFDFSQLKALNNNKFNFIKSSLKTFCAAA